MTLSKKTKTELIAEVNRLQKENIELTIKINSVSNSKNITLGKNILLSFLEHSKNYILLVNREGEILDLNRFESGFEKENIIGKNITSFIIEESIAEVNEAIKKTFETQKPQTYNTRRFSEKEGSLSYFNSTVTPIIVNGEVIAAIIDAANVTKEVNAQKELEKSEEKFRRLAQNAHDIVYRYAIHPEPKHEYISPSVEKITGYAVEEFYKDPQLGFKLIHPDDRHKIDRLKSENLDANTVEKNYNNNPRVLRWIRKDGETIWTETIDTPILDANGVLVAVEGISRDITDRKKIEQMISSQSQNELLSKHVEIIPGLVFQFKFYPDGRFMFPYSSKKIWNLFKINPLEVKHDGSLIFTRVVDEDKKGLILSIENSRRELSDWNYDFRVIHPDNGIRWLSGNSKPTKLKDGVVVWHGYITDITEHKEIIKKMNDSLNEKEILLKEVHHRVKNNLQVISSILNLQSSYVKDKSTLNVLQESQNRIKSMAFIHESLYQTNDFSSINFSDYVVNLLQNLMQSYSKLNQMVKLNLDLETIFLELDLAIPCGLIINEIMSNALKYAFIENKAGDEIAIKMQREEEKISLVIEDNGVGLPEKIDFKNTESLGLQLVVTLIDQIDGSIELDRKGGTKFSIIFSSKGKF